ncbi:hypothetical protein CTAYLR_008096 [Chrysophaeum taylorii]|uniref:PX domain-containing protein n=1 Tax=Chrysophaeum taylorii TaxID=2483200 RepID=A0AAD7XLR4_9STRA|nr:hypothetical protein CTAYLR_008096 [Chrysophaeum taylorii]
MVVVEELPSGGCVVRGELAGAVELLPEEFELFRGLFELFDVDGDGCVNEAEGRAFLRRGLSSEAAVERVWGLAAACCGDERGLELGGFLVACKLVGLAQALGVRSEEDAKAIALSRLSDPLSDAVVPKIADLSMRDSPPEGSIVVKVVSPHLVGEGIAQHTVYAVRTRSSVSTFSRTDFRVSRRFSDFEWCHDRLRKSSPGVVVPPLLSPKRWTKNTHHDFVRDRMESLTRFSNRLAAHPRLKGSLEVHALLDASPRGLEAAKRLDDALSLDPAALTAAAARAQAVKTPQRLPLKLLGGVLPQQHDPSDPFSARPSSSSGSSRDDERASAWASFLGQGGRKLGSVVSRAARVATRDISELWLASTPDDPASPYGRRAEATASTAFGRRLARLAPGLDRAVAATEALVKHKRNAAYEAARTGHYLGVAVAPPSGSADVLLARLGEALEAVAGAAQDHVDHEVADFVEQVRYQRALNAAGIEACRDRRKAAEATRRADDRAERAILDHAAARSTLDSRSSRVHVANARRVAAVAARDTALEDERSVERTLAAEALRLDRAKLDQLREATRDYVNINLAFVRASRARWQKLLSEIAQPTDDELRDCQTRLFGAKHRRDRDDDDDVDDDATEEDAAAYPSRDLLAHPAPSLTFAAAASPRRPPFDDDQRRLRRRDDPLRMSADDDPLRIDDDPLKNEDDTTPLEMRNDDAAADPLRIDDDDPLRDDDDDDDDHDPLLDVFATNDTAERRPPVAPARPSSVPAADDALSDTIDRILNDEDDDDDELFFDHHPVGP